VRKELKIKKLKLKINRGFTMIELLIVIAVLGILAVAVLATINPIEQINRGRDTGSRSDTEQLLSAIDRYNATQGLWPWQATTVDSADIDWGPVSAIEDGANCSLLSKISDGPTSDADCTVGADEVKASFSKRLQANNYNALYMEYTNQTGNSVYVCFSPQSGAFKTEATTRCADAAHLPGDWPVEACGGCADLPGAIGKSDNCICLP